MSLHPHIIEPVPEETARVARVAFPKGHPYVTFRDAFGTIFQDEDFAALFPVGGQPGWGFLPIPPKRYTPGDRQWTRPMSGVACTVVFA
jgi:hypothetical protein